MSMPAMTTNCSVVVAYADNSGTTFTEGTVPTVLNGTTSVTILPAPAAGVRRVVKSVCVYNPDTDTHTTTLIFNDNTTEYPITRLTLASGASWSSDDQTGVNVGGAVTDGDKGDISVSSGGTTWTIDDGVVSYGKIQSVTNNRLLGRSDTAGGQVQEITVGTGLSLSAGTLTATSGSMVYPGAGVAVSTGSAWGTSKASPSGDIVGTTDSQVLTNKTISGASNTLSNVNLASQVTGTLPVANGGTGATTSTGSGSVVLATSPTLTTPLLGVATGTSFNGITGLSSTTPIVDGTAAIGTGTTAARADHVHPTDTSRAATSGTLAQFAATTSAQLAGVISDETGSGALVFANSPTMTTPNIGAATGTSFNNITGLSSTTPSADSGSGVVGTSTTVARADHQHPVSGVTSFSAGSTGLTPSSGTTGAVTLAGMLAVTNGGTGATTAGGALTSLGAYPASNPNGYTSNTGTVTGVTGTSPVASSGGTAPAISLASGYGDTQNPYASKTAKFFLAAPNASAGAPTFREIVAADVPTLNQNTTGTASNVTGIVAVANGGTGLSSTPTNGQLNIGNGTGFTQATLTAGSNITITNGAGSITIASTASGGGGTLADAISGFNLTWLSGTSIQVATGYAYVPASSAIIELTAAATVSATGLNSLTWYFVYLYSSGGTGAIELSSVAPTFYQNGASIKTGDSSRRTVGAFLTSSTGAVYQFQADQSGSECTLLWYNVAKNAAPFRITVNGAAVANTNYQFALRTNSSNPYMVPTTVYKGIILAPTSNTAGGIGIGPTTVSSPVSGMPYFLHGTTYAQVNNSFNTTYILFPPSYVPVLPSAAPELYTYITLGSTWNTTTNTFVAQTSAGIFMDITGFKMYR